jgi:hypothetical protein
MPKVGALFMGQPTADANEMKDGHPTAKSRGLFGFY